MLTKGLHRLVADKHKRVPHYLIDTSRVKAHQHAATQRGAAASIPRPVSWRLLHENPSSYG